MAPTIEPHHDFYRILSDRGDMGTLIAAKAKETDRDGRIALARNYLTTAILTGSDHLAIVWLELWQRAQREGQEEMNQIYEGRRQFRRDLEEVFWGMPDATTGPGGGKKAFLTAAKSWIVRKLIAEWVAEPTDVSVYAFRRLIAMGWPQYLDRRLPGESDVEMRARKRFTSDEEQKRILAIVRDHMGTFGSCEEKKKGADAVFGPWINQPHVPDDLMTSIILNRAKVGGAEMARRDVRNAAVLAGLPPTAVEHVQDVIKPIKAMLEDCDLLRARLCCKIQERNPYWRQDLAPLPWRLDVLSISGVRIHIGPMNDPDETFADVAVLIEAMRTTDDPYERLGQCDLTVVVTESSFALKDREPKKLEKVWRKF